MVDHDRLFKELLTTYFDDFIDTFLPQVAGQIVPGSVEFLDKEIFTDIASDDKHVVDLIAKVRLKSGDAYFLIHIENQSKPDPNFPARMFQYFARLLEKYGLPVYPVVIFSHARPHKQEPSRYDIVVSGLAVLQFQYAVIQLNRIPWRSFMDRPSPVATALMTRMNILKEDRPKVRAECLRLLATLKLSPAKSRLIGVFVETYLKLNAEEMKVYSREFAAFEPEEQEAAMEMMTSWETKGYKKGKHEGKLEGKIEGEHEGKEELLTLLLQTRFSTMPQELTDKLDKLTSKQLNELAVALLDFKSLDDLTAWLSRK